MRYSPLYQYYVLHLKESEIKENEEIEEETEEIKNNQQSNKKPSNAISSDVQSIVKNEVKKAISAERAKIKKEEDSIKNQRRKEDDAHSLSPKKSANHKKSTTKKTKQSNESQIEQMSVLNLSLITPHQLSSIYERQFKTYLSQIKDSFCIFSVCLKQRRMGGNKNLTDLFQKELIRYDFCYLPIYVVNSRRQIIDIIFFVFNQQRRNTTPKRTYKDLYSTIVHYSQRYGINVALSFEDHQFIQTTNKREILQCNDYVKILLHYLFIRGYIKEEVSLCYCGKTNDEKIEKYRFSLNEIVLPTIS